jgi:uncharacterized membrane protein SpoIIM required for sporulation
LTPADFIQKRSDDWRELDRLINQMEFRRDRSVSSGEMLRFARLYRAVCTDLSLAGSFRLPKGVQSYLESLVSRGHSTLYAGRKTRSADVRRFFAETIPARVYGDIYVRICMALFFGGLFLCIGLAYQSSDFAVAVLGEDTAQEYREMHEGRAEEVSMGQVTTGATFYILNNVTIDILAFGSGILGGVGSLLILLFNAVYLGSILGYLLSIPEVAPHILSWIPAHAPFELTAVAMAAGAGFKIGFALVAPRGRERAFALREEARAAVPIIVAAALLTFFAAFLEAALGPANLPTMHKVLVGGASLALMIVYFGFMGHRAHRRANAEGSRDPVR